MARLSSLPPEVPTSVDRASRAATLGVATAVRRLPPTWSRWHVRPAAATGRLAGAIALLAAAYVVGARVGFMYALVGTNASPIWPPAGIAVAALWLGGRRLWPGIVVGSVVVNLLNGSSLLGSGLAGLAATAEALVAVELLRRTPFRPQLDRLIDVPILVVAGSAVPALVGATIGVGGLTASGEIGSAGVPLAWVAWWAGDALSILVLGGILLAWGSKASVTVAGRELEAAIALASVGVVSVVLFFDVFNLRAAGQSVAFPIIPLVVWVAFRIGPRGTTLAAVLFSAIAIAATERGLGPFVGTTRESTLLYLAVFTAIVASTGDAVAAVVAERDADRARLAAASSGAAEALIRLQAIEQIGRILAERGPTPAALQAVVDALADVFGYTHPSIYTGDERQVRLGAQRGYVETVAAFDGSLGIIGRVMRTQASQFLPVAERDPDFIRADTGVRSEIAVPLVSHGALLGVLNVESREPLDERDVASVSVVADRVAAALALALERDQLAELAIRDALTGLHNRRYLDDALQQLAARRSRGGHEAAAPLSIIMFDLDRFGDFNNRHGHLVGDEVLRVFGAILRGRFRAGDIVGRYGGEEFLAALPEAGLAQAVIVAEAIRAQLAGSTIDQAGPPPVRVTVSAGCASAVAGETLRELIERADGALATAKRAGRNQVVAA